MIKIAAVVVTYNRLELLKECINSLRNQTRKLDEIIVVNNDSTDGTKEWLNEQKDLSVIHQANLGGAGGFHTGIKTAYEKGYDWIWVMDDDGLPQAIALEELMKFEKKNHVYVLNSVVVTRNKPLMLNFGLSDNKELKYFYTYNELKKYNYILGANFFNGTLIHKSVITKVGYPNCNFFIYGDEYEFFLRIKNKISSPITVVKSIIMHPEQKHKHIGKGKFFHRFNFCTKLRATYYPRNLVIIYFLYREFKFKRLIKNFVLDIYCILRYQQNIHIALIYSKSLLTGFKEIIFNRKKYD